MQAWTALTESTTALFNSNLLNRFYAYNALYYMFNDQALVNNYVLRGLDTDLQNTLYTNSEFGLSTVKGL